MDVTYSERPTLHRPVFIAAFRGWNDAADAASTAVEFVQAAWVARPFASIDPEEFFDFQMVRPNVQLGDDGARELVWPDTVFTTARIPGTDRDAILLCGIEPSMRWRRFTQAVLSILRDAEVELAVTLGALLAEVPHSRPVSVTGSAADPDLAARLGLERSRYEGPTGIVGVVNDSFRRASIPSVSLWAATPDYVRDTPSPKAALELVSRLGTLLGVGFDVSALDKSAHEYVELVDRAIAEDGEVEPYVRSLERDWDERAGADAASGDSIAEELEQYLRNLRDDG